MLPTVDGSDLLDEAEVDCKVIWEETVVLGTAVVFDTVTLVGSPFGLGVFFSSDIPSVVGGSLVVGVVDCSVVVVRVVGGFIVDVSAVDGCIFRVVLAPVDVRVGRVVAVADVVVAWIVVDVSTAM